ncbi:NnrS family protein [Bordetella sp. BOR01]|uniref:NnrS family protein n=1 Tax=Bordetella sp. BOR01 TaxID=2854779 RepID=UPI001C47B9EB|nr:NnrS family protein [Bordetella sp. BOR01]MBV7485531.1 NnrS family protein [Bordetella sp. BOR01]
MAQISISPSALHRPSEPQQPPPSGWALFALGFRPFYLGGAIFAALAIAIWAAQLAGVVPPPAGSMGLALLWHAHEMVFGFAAVIVVGFLFTAGRAWTGVETPAGGALAALTALWLAGRLAMWFAPPPLAALLDGLFLPLAALAFTRVLMRAGNRRNYPIALALWVYAALNLAYHAYAWQGDAALALRACVAGLALPVLFVTVIGARVLPMFTTNAVPGFRLKAHPRLGKPIVAATIAALVAWVLAAPGWVVAPLSALTGVLLAVRVAGWRGYAVGNRPILWILHLAYAWLPAGFLLLAASALGWVMPGVAEHAFAVGVVGTAIIAMITRTALGHTGRRLVAGRSEVAAYWLIVVATLLRVGGPLLWPAGYLHWVYGAALCWVIGFALYALTYAPRLARPRVDGKPG